MTTLTITNNHDAIPGQRDLVAVPIPVGVSKARKPAKIRRVGRKLDKLADTQERRFKRYFKQQHEYIAEQLKDVPKGFDQNILDAIFGGWAAQLSGLTKIVNKFIPDAVKLGGDDGVKDLPIDIDFNLQHPEVVQWMDEFTGREITRINDTTRNLIKSTVIEAVRDGLGVDQIQKKIDEMYLGFSRVRSRLIAHNESAEGFSNGTFLAYKQSGLVDRVEWLTAKDTKVSKGCEKNEKAGPITLGSNFPSGHKVPPRHPRCRCSVLPVID